MELNNKKDLISLLAESEFQGINVESGNVEAYSVFEGIDANTQFRLFTDTHSNMKEWLNEQEGEFTLSALELVTICLRNIELNNGVEVLQFIWICGIMYHEIRVKLEAMKKLKSEAEEALKEKSSEEETSNMAVAIALDGKIKTISDLVEQLPVYRGWKEAPEWEKEYAATLEAVRGLIRKLY